MLSVYFISGQLVCGLNEEPTLPAFCHLYNKYCGDIARRHGLLVILDASLPDVSQCFCLEGNTKYWEAQVAARSAQNGGFNGPYHVRA